MTAFWKKYKISNFPIIFARIWTKIFPPTNWTPPLFSMHNPLTLCKNQKKLMSQFWEKLFSSSVSAAIRNLHNNYVTVPSAQNWKLYGFHSKVRQTSLRISQFSGTPTITPSSWITMKCSNKHHLPGHL